MKKVLLFLVLALSCVPAYALDKKIAASNTFKLGIYDTSSAGNGVAGLTLADLVIKVQCASTAVTIDESGDTLTDEGGGYYRITANDALSPGNEDECLVWVEGAGNYSGLLSKSPVKFKAVGATMSMAAAGAITGTAGGGSTATAIVDASNLTSTMAGAYVGSIALVDGETAVVKSFNAGTDTITLASTLSASAAGKLYYLIPASLWEMLSRVRTLR